jgi:multiple sugar transport system substrate-binding protein
MRKDFISILCIVVLLICGCAPKKMDERITIRFLDRPDRGGGWAELIAQFEAKYPNIKVELEEGPTATNTREDMYATSFCAGEDTYDLVYMDVIWVPKFADAGWIIPLDDKFPKEEQAKFLPGDIDGSIYNGKIYRVPMRSDAGMLYYRKDLLDKAGFTPPTTWKELVDIATKLQNPPDLYGFVFQGRQYEGLVCNYLELLWGAGGDIFDAEGNVIIDSKEAISALQWMHDVINLYKITPPGVTTYQEEESRHLFQQGKAVFMRNWPYAWTLAQKDDSPIKGKIGIVPMVHKENCKSAATLGGWGFGISKFSKHKEAAWEFIKFATSYEGQKAYHFKSGAIPTRHALFKDKEILDESPYYPQLYNVLINAKPRPMHPKYPRISDILQLHISAALVGKESPEVALKSAALEIAKELEQ